MTEFTPVSALVGGAMIGLAAVLYMAWQGRIAGVSGITSGLLPPWRDGAVLPARLGFLIGLVAAPLLIMAIGGLPVPQVVSSDLVLMGSAGLLTGFGTVLGGGCTSGHGVCGLARLSPRSIVATCMFMATAVVTVFLVRHVLGA